MATGGYVVALLNDGNKEYLEDGKNCLIYPNGDVEQAVQCIERIIYDSNLQNVLYTNGVKQLNQEIGKQLKIQLFIHIVLDPNVTSWFILYV